MNTNFRNVGALVFAGIISCFGVNASAKTAHGFPVEVPINQASFHLGLTGLYGKITNDDLFYAISGTEDCRRQKLIEPCHDFGWRVDAGYFFCGAGNDISANWTYLCTQSDCTSKSSRGVAPRLPSVWLTSVRGDAEFTFNEINVELGQKVDFCALHTRFHFGLSYACIEHCLEIRGSGMVTSTPSESQTGQSAYAKLESNFYGVGPRFGVDMTYPLGHPSSNFALVGHAAGALLCGEIEECGHARSRSQSSSNGFKLLTDDTYTVVPAGTFKIGVAYQSDSDPASAGYGVELGYQVSGYYHAVSHLGGGESSNFNDRVSNVGVCGAYLTLAYRG